MREDFFGFEMREDVGDFVETPSWGSAFPGGGRPENPYFEAGFTRNRP